MLVAEHLHIEGRLQDLCISVSAGQLVMLMGPNGAGKSSLLQAMAGLVALDSGTLQLHNKPIASYSLAALSTLRGYLEQQGALAFPITLQESLTFSLLNDTPWKGLPAELETALELERLLDRPLNRLSGGEQQRGAIARVLLPHWSQLSTGRAILLLDEPLQGLDLRHQHTLCELLHALALSGNLVVTSIHDVNMASQYASHGGLMKQGRMLHFGMAAEVLKAELLSPVFGCQIGEISTSHSTTFISKAPSRR